MSKDSYNIPLSFKVNESLLTQIEAFTESEGLTYSSMIRSAIIMFMARKYRDNTGMTASNRASW